MSTMIEVSKNRLLATHIAVAVLSIVFLGVLFKLFYPPSPPPVQTGSAAISDNETINIPKALEDNLRERGFAVLMLVNADVRIKPVAIDGTPLISCGKIIDGTSIPDSCGTQQRQYVATNQISISAFRSSRCGDVQIGDIVYKDVHLDGRYAGRQPCHKPPPPRRHHGLQ